MKVFIEAIYGKSHEWLPWKARLHAFLKNGDRWCEEGVLCPTK